MKVAVALFALVACSPHARAIDAPPPPADVAIDAPICGGPCSQTCALNQSCCLTLHVDGTAIGSCTATGSNDPSGCAYQAECRYYACVPNMPCMTAAHQTGTCQYVQLGTEPGTSYWVCQ